MKFKTHKAKEEYLNDLYSDSYSQEEAVENLIYLTSKNRAQRTTESHLIKCYNNNKLGTLLRRLDPTAFYTE